MGSGRRSKRRRVLVVGGAALALTLTACGSPVAHGVIAGASAGQSGQLLSSGAQELLDALER